VCVRARSCVGVGVCIIGASVCARACACVYDTCYSFLCIPDSEGVRVFMTMRLRVCVCVRSCVCVVCVCVRVCVYR